MIEASASRRNTLVKGIRNGEPARPLSCTVVRIHHIAIDLEGIAKDFVSATDVFHRLLHRRNRRTESTEVESGWVGSEALIKVKRPVARWGRPD